MRKLVLVLLAIGFTSCAVAGLTGCRHDLDEDARVSSGLPAAR